jgi:hypothetical protein
MVVRSTIGAVALIAVTAVGCADKPRADRATVTGSVTYQNKPIGFGIVVFVSKGNPQNQDNCAIKPDGTYLLTNAPVGPVKVMVQVNGAQDIQAYEARGEKAPADPLPRALGKKYAFYDTTPIELTVEPGEKKIDLEIK